MTIPKVGKTTPSNEVAGHGWYNSLYALSGGDYLKITEVLLRPIDESLMFLTYKNTMSFDEAVTINRIQN